MNTFMSHRDYGVIAKCPHCDATNIKRKIYSQFTCGSEKCKRAQNTLRRDRRGKSKATYDNLELQVSE